MITKTRFIAVFVLLAICFAFFFSLVPTYADENKKTDPIVVSKDPVEIKEDPEVVDPDYIPCHKYLDGIWFDDWDTYYDYAVEHYEVINLVKSGVPSSLANTSWIFNSVLDFNYFTQLAPDLTYIRASVDFDTVYMNSSVSYDLFQIYIDQEYLMFAVAGSSYIYPYSNLQWSHPSCREVYFTSDISYFSGLDVSYFRSWVSQNATQVLLPVVSTISVSNGTFTISDGVDTSSSSPFQTDNGNDLTLIITPSLGYDLPSEISITGTHGTVTNQGNGVWLIEDVTTDLDISAVCDAQVSSYTVTFNITHGSGGITDGQASGSPSLTVSRGSNVQLSITPSSGYILPDSSAFSFSSDVAYDSFSFVSSSGGTGIWQLTNISGNLTVSVTCPSYVPPVTYTITYDLTNCSTLASTSVVSGGSVSGTIVPYSGYTYPSSINVVGSGIPISSDMWSYNSSNGEFTITNITGNYNVIASAISASADVTITYDLENCTCSINSVSASSGSTLTFTLTPNSGYLMDSSSTKVGQGGSYELNISSPGSYSFSYSFLVEGDIIITGVAVGWQDALTAEYTRGFRNGGGGSNGSYIDGYNTGYTEGQGSVSCTSSDYVGKNIADEIFDQGISYGISSVNPNDNGVGGSLYRVTYGSGYADGINSVNYLSSLGTPSRSQYDLIFNAGINSVVASAPQGSLSLAQYNDIYRSGFDSGYGSVSQGEITEAITGFVPSILASIGGGLLYTGEHITVFGITLASLFGLLIVFAVVVVIFKFFKGSL